LSELAPDFIPDTDTLGRAERWDARRHDPRAAPRATARSHAVAVALVGLCSIPVV